MASLSYCNHDFQKPICKPLMLKDYLRDDLSSCSSNGFKSFPRRGQCCTTVRFLLEIDLQNKHYSTVKKHPPLQLQLQQQKRRLSLRRSRSKAAASTAISALHRASEAFINAVKLLPFPSSSSTVKSPSRPVKRERGKKGILLSRSFSRRLFNKSSWRKPNVGDKEDNDVIPRRRSFLELLKENNGPSDLNTQWSSIATSATSTEAVVAFRSSTSTSRSSSSERSNSKSWGECDSPNDAIGIKSDSRNEQVEKVSSGVGVTVGEQDSVTNSTVKSAKEWKNEEEKEQSSPVSVLDYPFQDDEETASPFHPTLIHNKGSKQRTSKKHRSFKKSLAQIEPLDLEKRIALSAIVIESNENSADSSLSSVDTPNENGQKDIDEAQDLFSILQSRMKADNKLSTSESQLFRDFLKEKIEQHGNNAIEVRQPQEEFKVAQDWINGKTQQKFLGWEVIEGRQAYVKDMEMNEKWRNFDEEVQEVAVQLELEVFTFLVNETLDMF